MKRIKRTPFRVEVKTSAKRPQSPPEKTCFEPCLEGGIGKCNYMQNERCEGHTPCNATRAKSILTGEKIIEEIFFDLDLMYAFRDDFLYNSEKGEDYIDNYYFLSEEYEKKIGIPLALQTALFFKDFNPVMKAFVNPEYHLKEIMFTDELSNSLLNLLDKYETITTSSEGKAILASIRKDINSFKNKPLQDILAVFK
jgi:hypothetical protein